MLRRFTEGCLGETNPNRARDHLANERTFLAWVRTGAAIVVFGFAIGRFSIAMRQLTAFEGHPVRTAGFSVWMGAASILAGWCGIARHGSNWITILLSPPDLWSIWSQF
jgi:uncharacterized membrane protein YidH (DUF202 family)